MSSDINVQTFSGKVNITSNLLVGTSHLFVDTINNRVGLVTSNPDAGLHVNSNAYVHTDFRVGSGIVMNDTNGRITAGSFVGDGSGLDGINSDSGSWVNGTNSNVHLATSTDSVGIGTTSPSNKLHVETPVNTSENLVKIGSYMNNGSRSVSGIEFATNPQFFNGDNGQRVPAKIKAGFYGDGPLVANWPDAYISLQTTVNNGGLVDNLVCRGGNVGIRKTDPLSLLDIKVSSTSPAIRFSDSGQNRYACGIGGVHVSNEGQRLDFYVGDSGSNTTNLDSGDLRMSIKHNGNVGIGTASPIGKLDVRGAIMTPVISYSGNQDAPYLIAGTSGYTGAATNWNTHGFQHRIKTNSGGTPRITVDAPSGGEVFSIVNGGNVGIGTTSPDDKLHLYGATDSTLRVETDTGQAQLLLRSGASTRRACRIDFSRADTGTQYMQLIGDYQQNGTDDLTVATSTSGRIMTWLQNGNVGIGTTSPGYKLDVNGDINSSGKINIGDYAVGQGYMASRTLTLGSTSSNYGGGNNWNTNTAAILLECADNTEIAVHDGGTRVASLMHFEGSPNRITIGRDMGWGTIASVRMYGSQSYPNRPVAMVGKNNARVYTPNVIVYNIVLYNDGGLYNTSNGRFTAPAGYAGYYLVTYTGLAGEREVAPNTRWQLNGNDLAWGAAHVNMGSGVNMNTTNARVGMNNQFIYYLNAGDYLTHRVISGSIYGFSSTHSTTVVMFMGSR